MSVFGTEPMQVDDSALVPPTTPPRSTTPSQSMTEQKFKNECTSNQLQRNVYPDDDDDQIKRALKSVWVIVSTALEGKNDLEGHLATFEQFLDNVKRKGEREFIGSLKDMASKRTWHELFQNNAFVVIHPHLEVPSELKRAAMDAWGNRFEGDAANVLLGTISDLLNKQRRVYARQTCIINSSGTGKSRMVDQVAVTIITIPMCLRAAGTQGFPPADEALRIWIQSLAIEDRGVVARKFQVFLTSLFIILRERLETIASQSKEIQSLPISTQPNERALLVAQRQRLLAAAFREAMTDGQTFDHQNEYRKRFYDDVISETKQVNDQQKSPPRYEFQNTAGVKTGGVKDAGLSLCKYLDPQGLLDSAKGPRWPLVILYFDEAHLLMDLPERPSSQYASWTLFSELRQGLREVVDRPIFTLFLSTAGRPNVFSPPAKADPSTRMYNLEESPVHPISEISFDDLAYPAYPNSVTLDRVVELDWISHLGRPLFGSHFSALLRKNGREDQIISFAKQKLLNSDTESLEDKAGLLACLCVRFALEFGTNPNARTRATLHEQIEQHMRLCIAATTGFEEFVTIAGSEPLLAEAAFELIRASNVNPVRHLANHSDLYCVDRGRRGELVATLIIMQARDIASQPPRRWMPVYDFFKALLPSFAFQTLHDSTPTFWRKDEKMTFGATFANYAMWFNHIIKIEDSRMIAVEHLWSLITRGAMIMCTDNQVGVDIVLPVCVREEYLGPKTVTAVVIQVKNSKHYGHNIEKTLFDNMGPFSIGLFPDNWPARPIIRMVFALASDEPSVLLAPGPERRSRDRYDPFTAFDIWCAGLSTATFNHIGGYEDSYKLLLQRSLQSHDTFDLGEPNNKYLDDETRTSRGLRRRRLAALSMSEHNFIHVPPPPTPT